MKDIRVKEKSSAPRVLDSAARAPKELMRKRAMAAKEQAEHITVTEQDSESPEQYAENKAENTAKEATEQTRQVGGKALHKAKEIRKSHINEKGGTEQRSSLFSESNTVRRGRERAAQSTAKARKAKKSVEDSVRHTAKTTRGVVREVKKPADKVKNTVKTMNKAVKTAKNTVKAAQKGVKTARHTVKATQKAAKAAQKAAQASAKAAKAAAKAAEAAAKATAKAIAAIIKAIIAGIKGLAAAIAAGGWVAVIVIIVVALAAVLLAVLGVFAGNETPDGSKPMTEAIHRIDDEFHASIDTKIAELSAGGYDEVAVKYIGDMDGDSDYLVNWNDVIAVYSVAVTMDPENPADTVQVTPEKIERLKSIFYDMNKVSYSSEIIETEETIETEDGEEETVTRRKLIISITVESMDAHAAAEQYNFNADQRETLEIMMAPEMLPMYAQLIGVDVYGGADLTQVVSGLPTGKMGTDVLNAALTKVGAPYVLGAKGPNRFDCSGLVYWSINEVDPELGRHLYTSAGYQYKYCKDNGYIVGESEIQPGDLIFWYKPNCTCGAKYAEVHHVGFYLGDGMILDASSSNGRVIIRKLFNGSSYRVLAYARPYSY